MSGFGILFGFNNKTKNFSPKQPIYNNDVYCFRLNFGSKDRETGLDDKICKDNCIVKTI